MCAVLTKNFTDDYLSNASLLQIATRTRTTSGTTTKREQAIQPRKRAKDAGGKAKATAGRKSKGEVLVADHNFLFGGIEVLKKQLDEKLAAAGMNNALVANVMRHAGSTFKDHPIFFDQDDFYCSRAQVLKSAQSAHHYRDSALYMSPNRISGDDFAVTGDLASKLCIMCNECLTPTFGAHDKEKGGFQCNAFGLKRVPQTNYNYIILKCGLGQPSRLTTF